MPSPDGRSPTVPPQSPLANRSSMVPPQSPLATTTHDSSQVMPRAPMPLCSILRHHILEPDASSVLISQPGTTKIMLPMHETESPTTPPSELANTFPSITLSDPPPGASIPPSEETQTVDANTPPPVAVRCSTCMWRPPERYCANLLFWMASIACLLADYSPPIKAAMLLDWEATSECQMAKQFGNLLQQATYEISGELLDLHPLSFHV